MSEPQTKVIIVGAGIAGPVLSLFLNKAGYVPVIYERTESIADAGLSLVLQPNGMQVLNKIPGLVESIEGRPLEQFQFYSVLPEDKGLLATSDIPRKMRDQLGLGMLGVRRSAFHQTLIDTVEKLGIPVKMGHKVVAIEQGENAVTVKLENGVEDTASFVIGCDGLHSNTRICLFGEENAQFTGLVQTGGICPNPDSLKDAVPAMTNFFGNGGHIITYPVSATHRSWAATEREPEAKETWRAMDQNKTEEFKKDGLFADWGYGAGDIVKNSEKIIKYGLYDRPELSSWHKGRVCLIGDAAHPTSPHLGQGANQAFEDVNLLAELLEHYNTTAAAPSTATLETIFTEFEKVRIPRCAILVKKAREQGESRVVHGVGNCIKRNDAYRDNWKDDDSVIKHMGQTYAD